MNFDWRSVILEVIAFFGVILAPIVTILAGRRKYKSEIILLDMETLELWNSISKQWTIERAELGQEITKIHDLLIEEKGKRIADREKYQSEIARIEEELAMVNKELAKCTKCNEEK